MREGRCYPQSEASQLAAAMLAPPRGATVLDCAAAPGGKATHLAEIVGKGRQGDCARYQSRQTAQGRQCRGNARPPEHPNNSSGLRRRHSASPCFC